jgi:hypothetical protein
LALNVKLTRQKPSPWQECVSHSILAGSAPSSARAASPIHIPQSISATPEHSRTSGRSGHVAVSITATPSPTSATAA